MIENTTNVQIHLFYPLLFLTIIIIAGLITFIMFKCKDSTLFNNIFNKHVDEHIDTTDKMKDMHDNVAKIAFTSVHEQEIHHIECLIKEISFKLDALTERVIYLEKHKN